MGRFEGMTAIVVGGADGIGGATCEILAEGGANVMIGYNSKADTADALAESIRKMGSRAITCRIDHSQEDQVAAMVAATLEAFGSIHILVNNAARVGADFIRRDGDIVNMDGDYWDEAQRGNLKGPMLTCKHTIPHMIAAGYGSIVLTGSGVVFRGDTVRNAYAASKIGLHSLAMDIATSYGKQNVRCNVVSPGLVLSPAIVDKLEPESVAALAGQNTVPFVGEPRDIAHVSCFLASREARYLTGQVIPVDGGLHVHQAVIGQV